MGSTLKKNIYNSWHRHTHEAVGHYAGKHGCWTEEQFWQNCNFSPRIVASDKRTYIYSLHQGGGGREEVRKLFQIIM